MALNQEAVDLCRQRQEARRERQERAYRLFRLRQSTPRIIALILRDARCRERRRWKLTPDPVCHCRYCVHKRRQARRAGWRKMSSEEMGGPSLAIASTWKATLEAGILGVVGTGSRRTPKRKAA